MSENAVEDADYNLGDLIETDEGEPVEVELPPFDYGKVIENDA